MRVALYCRVSTDEQARHGQSIEAQLFHLREWADKNGHTIVGEYIDAGVSGKKPPAKRPELARFFQSLRDGAKVDLLAFCKLDRFFRSVKLYYQAVDVLDKYNVAWQAIHEDYETLTAGGRMKVNIMLSVAENEVDRTAERIKVVFERKIANGECVNPHGLPIGYSYDRESKKIVPNQDADIVRDTFEHYAKTGSIRDTLYYIGDKYEKRLIYQSLSILLRNRLYIGEYRDNVEYCAPIVDKELFDYVQISLEKRSVRHNQTDRIYFFSGIVYCGVCGRRMVGVYNNNSGNTTDYNGYRCPRAYQSHLCSHRRYYSERKIEAYLLEHMRDEVAKISARTDIQAQKKRRKTQNVAEIKAKMSRLKDLYVDGLIDKEEYLKDREKLMELLEKWNVEPDQSGKRLEKVREIFLGGLEEEYSALGRAEKRDFWRAILTRIEITDGDIRFYF